MMWIIFSKCFLLLVITRIGGVPWRRDNLSVNERTMETIFDFCYENDSSSGPIVILGDYNGFHDKSSIIRLNNSFEVNGNSEKDKFHNSPASKIIVIGESWKRIEESMQKLIMTKWWKNTTPLFIVNQNPERCRIRDFALLSRTLESPNSIQICVDLTNKTSVLTTVNWFANYAPHPWKRLRKIDDANIFYQVFDPYSSCQNLNYDTTKILNGHQIIMSLETGDTIYKPSIDFFDLESGRWQNLFFYKTMKFIIDPFLRNGSDITLNIIPRNLDPSWYYLFPYPSSNEILAVVKLNREQSTLEKISRVLNTPVLHLGAIVLSILYLVLIMLNPDFSSAILDLTRLLIYSPILKINGRHSFRIYFTTMLIFMVVCNGLLQGYIAALSTITERVKSIETIKELIELDYKMYHTIGKREFLERACPECNFTKTTRTKCVDYVLNFPFHACLMWKRDNKEILSSSNLDYVKEPFFVIDNPSHVHREGWPLANSFNDIIIALIESGIMNFWENPQNYRQRGIRQNIESEWHYPQYRAVKLYELAFAFHVLALGLLISTIIFLLELSMVKCKVFSSIGHHLKSVEEYFVGNWKAAKRSGGEFCSNTSHKILTTRIRYSSLLHNMWKSSLTAHKVCGKRLLLAWRAVKYYFKCLKQCRTGKATV